ncbi:DUF3857 domain-containing protein [Mucilaginibacter sp. BT774]|uniref:DUF3857 domain-containing protein n=1 Tax=Mucilaginibacter sp. BT774 TaxID=3062276 RepID=UPI002674581E|nr:DUF3857 domain-containing protein [Mucilaginibacter sp. BT774]MDO3627023.1 DUF3857 domain-containing protein [Mucilaginibacter sp. BT774]
MNKFCTLILLCAFCTAANAQTTTVPTTQPYGKVDRADLELKACDFEKDANAEVLFDKGSVTFTADFNLIFERHVRIKIFNDKAKDAASVRLAYWGGGGMELLSNVEAETINLNNGIIEITKVDKKLIYTQAVDRMRSSVAFSFPNVQPGSIIEFKYTLMTANLSDFPNWYFQDRFPTRYSELNSTIPNVLVYKNLVMVNLPFVKNTADVKAMANIPSIKDEPYMGSRKDNYQRILYQLLAIHSGAYHKTFSDTWKKIGEDEVRFNDFGGEFDKRVDGEDTILVKAKTLSTDDAKIAYLFGEVKNHMKWNEVDERYTNDGCSKAWQKKLGNSTEINLILYHLLHKAKVKGYPMLVSTKQNGKVNPAYPNRYQFNRTVVYVPIDSTKFYLLDATNKYNTYGDIPDELLNGFGLYIDKDNENYDLAFIEKATPVRNVIVVNAEIAATGKMEGTAEISSPANNRISYIKNYKENGEKKYIDYLQGDDNNLKIKSLKFENMEIDTLPLTQNISFTLDLTGSDENYIYFKPTVFTSVGPNPFLNEVRMTDIDFGYRNNYAIVGLFKIPAGYKSDGLPKNASMAMPDQSIVFKRIVAEQDGEITIKYAINYNKSIFFKDDYPVMYDFYKKMYEMLNEQIVLKKG